MSLLRCFIYAICGRLVEVRAMRQGAVFLAWRNLTTSVGQRGGIVGCWVVCVICMVSHPVHREFISLLTKNDLPNRRIVPTIIFIMNFDNAPSSNTQCFGIVVNDGKFHPGTAVALLAITALLAKKVKTKFALKDDDVDDVYDEIDRDTDAALHAMIRDNRALGQKNARDIKALQDGHNKRARMANRHNSHASEPEECPIETKAETPTKKSAGGGMAKATRSTKKTKEEEKMLKKKAPGTVATLRPMEDLKADAVVVKTFGAAAEERADDLHLDNAEQVEKLGAEVREMEGRLGNVEKTQEEIKQMKDTEHEAIRRPLEAEVEKLQADYEKVRRELNAYKKTAFFLLAVLTIVLIIFLVFVSAK